MKHKLEWSEDSRSNEKFKAFVALSLLHDDGVPFSYCVIKQKGRWVDYSEPELLDSKYRSWSNLSDAKRMLQNRENRFLKNL